MCWHDTGCGRPSGILPWEGRLGQCSVCYTNLKMLASVLHLHPCTAHASLLCPLQFFSLWHQMSAQKNHVWPQFPWPTAWFPSPPALRWGPVTWVLAGGMWVDRRAHHFHSWPLQPPIRPLMVAHLTHLPITHWRSQWRNPKPNRMMEPLQSAQPSPLHHFYIGLSC